MLQPGRKHSVGSGYRYGFNGQENDNEVKGEGNQQDYGMRIYDGRLGRFLSVDPISHEFPWWTSYQFAGNTPVNTIDMDGLEVPQVKNKNKTEVQKALGAVNFSGAKANRVSYEDVTKGGNPFKNVETFGFNTAIAGWNQLVDLAETGVNLTSIGGRMKIWDEQVMPTAKFIFFDWPNLTPEQQLNFIKTAASDPETWENLLASLAMAIVTERYIPIVKLPIPKELVPLKKEISAIIEPNLLKGSGSLSGVIELNSSIKSNKAFLNGISKTARDFVYDPTSQKFVMAGDKAKWMRHYGLRKAIGAAEDNVVGGRIKLGVNGEILTSQWSGTYGGNWSEDIATKFKEFIKKMTGKEINHSNKLTFSDGTQ